MKLREYIFGRKITLHSHLSPEEVADAIDRGAGSSFSPFEHGVTGGIWFGQVRLSWHQPIFNFGFRPVLTGRITAGSSGSVLHAQYGFPYWALAVYLIWLLILLLITGIMLLLYVSPASETGNEWILLVVPFVFASPVILDILSRRKDDEHLDAILDSLERDAELTVETDELT